MDIHLLQARSVKREAQEVRINYVEEQLQTLKGDLARVELLRDDEEERFAQVRRAHNAEKKSLAVVFKSFSV